MTDQTEQLDIFKQLNEVDESPNFTSIFGTESEQESAILEHKAWLKSIRHERPNKNKAYKIGVYIRYFNQTRYENYIDLHMKQFEDTIALCPNWTLHDFYIDEGNGAPNMESAPDWCRLLGDCFAGDVDLIITQKVSNVSKKPHEITFLSRILAAHNPPIGIYFISEDIFTLATYYQHDLRNNSFFPTGDWHMLEDDPREIHKLESGGNE